MNDMRFSRALAAAMVAAPDTPERVLVDVTRAVLHAGDEYGIDQELASILCAEGFDVTPSDYQLLDVQHPDSDGTDRRFDPGDAL